MLKRKSQLLKKTPLKRTSKPLTNNKGIKRGGGIKRKAKTAEEKQQQKEDIEKMWNLFNEHWDSKPHQCESCNTPLWGQNLSLYHHHCLEKGVDRYEHLKYEIDNLMMLCGDCHTAVTNGFPGERVIQKTEEVKIKFNV